VGLRADQQQRPGRGRSEGVGLDPVVGVGKGGRGDPVGRHRSTFLRDPGQLPATDHPSLDSKGTKSALVHIMSRRQEEKGHERPQRALLPYIARHLDGRDKIRPARPGPGADLMGKGGSCELAFWLVTVGGDPRQRPGVRGGAGWRLADHGFNPTAIAGGSVTCPRRTRGRGRCRRVLGGGSRSSAWTRTAGDTETCGNPWTAR